MTDTLEEGLRLEGDLAAFLYTTEDAKEGPAAFLEKRARFAQALTCGNT